MIENSKAEKAGNPQQRDFGKLRRINSQLKDAFYYTYAGCEM
jgi:hypothetical protein